MAYGNYAPFYRGGYLNPMQNMQMPTPPMPDNSNQYGQQFQMPMQAPPAPIPMLNQPTSDMILVLNENEATSYFVAPNNTVTLWDKNLPTIYVKSVDGNGVPSMRIFDYVERVANTPQSPAPHKCNCGEKFVTIEAFNELKSQFESLAATCRNENKTSTQKTKTEVTEDE